MKYSGRSPASGQSVEVHELNGRISEVQPTVTSDSDVWIAPGLIDIQVNGYAGVDYNTPSAPLNEIARSIEAQRSTGVTRFLPTIITGSNENISGSLRNLARAKRELPQGGSIVGFHVEGPWISPVDGPRGAHPQEHVRAATIEEYKQFQDAAEGQIRILTIAPEQEGVLKVIERAARDGVIVSIGHTNADGDQIRDAVRAGATMSTHLGNGSHQILPRFPNYILEQMACDELSAGLIVDGIHLAPCFVKIAVRAKGIDRSILTTDAVAPAGCQPGVYTVGHVEVELTPEYRVQRTDNGRLAGSALRLDRALGNLIRFADISLYEALLMATVNAAQGIRLDGRRGFLQAGDLADLIVFRYDPGSREVEILKTICSPAS
jgi:N-acetylglucosamine-6-phosphate deacetylase